MSYDVMNGLCGCITPVPVVVVVCGDVWLFTLLCVCG